VQNKTLTISVLLILALIVGGYFLLRDKGVEETKVPDGERTGEKVEALVDESLVEEETYTEPDQYATFNVAYPQFKNVGAEFNSQIRNAVIDAIADHKRSSADSWQGRYKTQLPGEKISEFPAEEEKYSLNISWDPIQVNKQFISFTLFLEAYTGGAHGYITITSFNYGVIKKEEVRLTDLFPNDKNYLKTVSDFARKDLLNQFRKQLEIKNKADEEDIMPLLLSGTAPDLENFSIFTFTPEQITFYFTEYQVAPYAMGSFTVSMLR